MDSCISYKINEIESDEFPKDLLEIPHQPKKLFIVGELPDPSKYYYLSIVGSRKYTSYGREATERIIKGLAGYPIVIVSGLAMGIDCLAHHAALNAGLFTVAIPGSGLDQSVLYPRTNLALAREIITNRGALLSEFEPNFRATQWSFPQRNRLMAGISQGTLIIEAEEKSGTLITARLALDYNRNVYAVPGSIFSATSKGTNNLIRQGATPIVSSQNLLEELGLKEISFGEYDNKTKLDLTIYTLEEQKILLFLETPKSREEILTTIEGPTALALSILTTLEIRGAIQEKNGKIERM